MRCQALPAAVLAVAFAVFPAGVRAQATDSASSQRPAPSQTGERATDSLTFGSREVPAGSVVSGPVVVAGGNLTVNGTIQGSAVAIAGDVVIDNGYFAPQGDDRAAFDNRPYSTYNVLPDALLINFQTVTINAVPDVATGTVRVSANPWPANLAIDSSVRLDPGPCRRGAGGISISMPEGATGSRVVLGGRYAAGCGQFSVSRAVMKPPDFAFGVLHLRPPLPGLHRFAELLALVDA